MQLQNAHFSLFKCCTLHINCIYCFPLFDHLVRKITRIKTLILLSTFSKFLSFYSFCILTNTNRPGLPPLLGQPWARKEGRLSPASLRRKFDAEMRLQDITEDTVGNDAHGPRCHSRFFLLIFDHGVSSFSSFIQKNCCSDDVSYYSFQHS